MKNIIIKFWNKGKGYIKAIGINGLLAILIWLSPSWLALFIPALEPYAVKWLIMVVSPAVPSWAALPMLTLLVALLRIAIVRLYKWLKDQVKKLKIGAEMFTLAGPRLLELILIKLREMHKIKTERTVKFKEDLQTELENLIMDNWETDVSQVKEEENEETHKF